MALLDSRGIFRRCDACDTAVAEDASICPACNAELAGAAPPPRAPGRPVFGTAGAGIFGTLGLGPGTGAMSAAIENFFTQLFQAFGQTAVRLLGMKTGDAALDDNPFRDPPIGAGPLLRRQIWRLTFGFRTNLSENELIGLYRDLAKYSDAGVGFHDALSRLEKSAKSPVMKRVLKEIRTDIVEGSTLGDAFGRHAYLFEPLHLALLEVGESLGTLGENMRVLVETMQERRDLRRQIARKFVQPIGLIFIANYILTIPIYMMGGPLDYLSTIIPPTLGILGALAFFFIVVPVLVAAAGRGMTDRLLLDLPAFGSIARANALARFAGALGAALGAGVEMGKSISISAKAADNAIVSRAILASLEFVKRDGLAEGLRKGGVLPDDIASELAHGEATGTVAPTLRQIAKDARERSARGTAVLGSILSFALIVFSVLYCVYSVFTKAIFGTHAGLNKMLHENSLPSGQH